MKKITLLLICLSFTIITKAQNTLFFSDSSDGSMFTTIDEDGDFNEWFNLTFADLGIIPAYPGFSDDTIFTSDSFGSTIDGNNSLITPNITIPSDASSINFSMIVSGSNDGSSLENYAVYVFDADVVTTFEGTDAEYNAPEVTEILQETLTAADQGIGNVRTASIPASLAGKNMRVAIRHFNTDDQIAIFIDDITVTSDGTLSIKDNQLNVTKTFPNPVKDVMTVNADFNIEKATVYSQLGQEVKTFNTVSNNAINMSSLNTGLYFVRLEADGKQSTVRVIKE
ncbi:T9SS type A sorting domain-containing protein [uncultured Algibacter sp.]|uniref:T9SS type A sorting domain-containing protein n=1 Tax=uncultured Algibacter sp. TaxID=298659 RepID=UPI0032172C30